MAVKTPEDRALADVERAIDAHKKAQKKHEDAAAKAAEAEAAVKRAHRELNWRASHPDLPEDFDIETFRHQLEAPFDDAPETADGEDEPVAGGDVVVGDDDPEAAIDDDDPFA